MRVYKNREDLEARARRSQRRRWGGIGGGCVAATKKVEAEPQTTKNSSGVVRRVRFMDVEVSAVVTTT